MHSGILLSRRLGLLAVLVSGLVTSAVFAVLMQVSTVDASHSRGLEASASVRVSVSDPGGTGAPFANFSSVDFIADPGTTEFAAVFVGRRKQSVDMKSWIKDCLDGLGDECSKDLTIQLVRGNEVLETFNFFDCYPIRFSAPDLDSDDAGTTQWTLEIRVNRWEAA